MTYCTCTLPTQYTVNKGHSGHSFNQESPHYFNRWGNQEIAHYHSMWGGVLANNSLEASLALHGICPQLSDSHTLQGDHVQTHLQQHVLYITNMCADKWKKTLIKDISLYNGQELPSNYANLLQPPSL